jgi:SPP1 gp7 family putative phage head morphogenesis protein
MLPAITGIEFKDLDWPEEDDELFDELYPALREAALAAAKTAMTGLVDDYGVGVDWALVNQRVVEWAKKYVGGLVRGINEVTRDFLRSAVSDWVSSGKPLEDLVAEIEPMFGSVRAELIATTEVTKAFAEGNLATWRESGVVSGKRWMTAEDELVCPICSPLDGMVVELDENGFTTEEGGVGLTAPPAHPNCRCYLQPFVEEPE